MHQTQSKEHILSLEFFKDSIQLYTQKHFLKFIENPTQIYTETFDDDTLTPLLTNLILFFKTLIIKNRLSKLWNCVAGCITINMSKLCEVYLKEIKSFESISLSPQQHQQQQQPHRVIRDKDLANINLYKIKLITLSFEVCVKGLNDASVYWDNNLFSSEMNELLKWLNNFCLMKSNGDQILNNFIENYLLKLPEYINSKYTKFNVNYIKWVHLMLVKNDLCKPNSELYKKINRIIETEKVLYNNAFDKMKQASKENRDTRFSRSRGTSFDKAEFTSVNCGGNSSCCDSSLFKKNYTLDKYFKKTQQPQQQQQQPQHQQQQPQHQQKQQQQLTTETNNAKNTSFKGLNHKYNNINTMNSTNTRVIATPSQHDINTNSSFTFTFNNNNTTIAIGNSYEDNYSSSQLSIRKHFNSNTSFSLQSDYTSTGDDALSYTKCYSSSGINSLLKTKHSQSSSSIGYYYPTVSSHKPKAKDYKNSLHQKITARLAKMTHINNENININITTIKKKEINENMKWMDDNFYKVSSNTTASSTLNSSTNNKHTNNNVLNSNNTNKTNNNNNGVTTSNKKTHSRTNNTKAHHSSNNNEDILAYKTPIKSNGILSKKIFDKGSNRDISPGTTRKNLLQLFQQVNK